MNISGKPHSWTHWKSLSDEINLDILPLEQNLQLPASPGQHSSRGLSEPGGLILSDFYQDLHLYGLGAILVLVIVVITLLVILYGQDLGARLGLSQQGSSSQNADFQTEAASSLIRWN